MKDNPQKWLKKMRVIQFYFEGDIVERLMKPQWFLKMDGMAARALEAAETGSLQFDPQVNQKLWGQWLKGHR